MFCEDFFANFTTIRGLLGGLIRFEGLLNCEHEYVIVFRSALSLLRRGSKTCCFDELFRLTKRRILRNYKLVNERVVLHKTMYAACGRVGAGEGSTHVTLRAHSLGLLMRPFKALSCTCTGNCIATVPPPYSTN